MPAHLSACPDVGHYGNAVPAPAHDAPGSLCISGWEGQEAQVSGREREDPRADQETLTSAPGGKTQTVTSYF